mmetsp:Transcript_126734/g.354847  ORF Transcript_126734/g.354847 Transcript_126734/m.354847 type:complete len:249 (+) Transcript_126734:308-1054(+)
MRGAPIARRCGSSSRRSASPTASPRSRCGATGRRSAGTLRRCPTACSQLWKLMGVSSLSRTRSWPLWRPPSARWGSRCGRSLPFASWSATSSAPGASGYATRRDQQRRRRRIAGASRPCWRKLTRRSTPHPARSSWRTSPWRMSSSSRTWNAWSHLCSTTRASISRRPRPVWPDGSRRWRRGRRTGAPRATRTPIATTSRRRWAAATRTARPSRPPARPWWTRALGSSCRTATTRSPRTRWRRPWRAP